MTVGLLVAAVAACILLAAWGWTRARDDEGFFAASRSAGPVLAGLGGTAAGLSAFVFVGGPGLMASLGVASLWIVLSAPFTGALQCWAVGEPLTRLARMHGCLTIPGVVASRFGEGAPRALAALAIVAGGVATLAVQVKGIAILGGVLTGRPGWVSAVVLVALTATYTAAGGMRSGLLAEAFQGLLMGSAALLLAGVALERAGGPGAAAALLATARAELLDPFNGIGIVGALGWLLLFGLGTCAQPHYLQKFLLLRGPESLRWMPAVMTVALLAVLTVWFGVGLGATALWLDGGLIASTPDEVAPALLRSLPPVLMALAAAAIGAAVMSTATTLLNLVAAALTRDLPRAMGRGEASGLLAPRLATVGTALAALGLGLAADRPLALLGVLGWGMFTAALLPVIVLGLNWNGATVTGAVAAMLAGPAVQIALELGGHGAASRALEPGLTGAAVGTLALVGLSLARPDRSSVTPVEVEP